jgi:hypothetical protein
METRKIVKYADDEPIYANIDLTVHPSKVNTVNGCVNGIPCEHCKWGILDKRCPSDVYCKKPTYMACP